MIPTNLAILLHEAAEQAALLQKAGWTSKPCNHCNGVGAHPTENGPWEGCRTCFGNRWFWTPPAGICPDCGNSISSGDCLCYWITDGLA